ncbi:MAG TPA: HEAT repeat domain-containing protein [Nitrospiraceae bacterium]|nr:HEAT repeat domain-containing protein [Nitrospiraceae bacterium]
MSRASLLSSLLAIGLLWGSLSVLANERTLKDAEYELLRHVKTIYVDVAFSTWMPRGKSLTDVAPTLRTSMASAGFNVVRNSTDYHDLTLKVDYREERGKQYKFDMYGTDITCLIRLEHPELGSLLDMTIKESSANPESGTPPYLETLERFQTNPYFYFLGQFVKASISARLNRTGVLLQSLQRLVDNEYRRSDLRAPDLGDGMLEMVQGETLYPQLVRENTIRELGRLKDPRAVPLLTTLLGHGNRQVRLLSVHALREIQADEARPAIERVAQQDGDREVRQAAAAALADLSNSSPTP